MIIRFLLAFIFLNLSVVSSEEQKVSLIPENIRNAVWNLNIPYKKDFPTPYGHRGTGSFVSKPHYFLTNLHIFYQEENHPLDYDVNNPHFTLIKEGEPERRLDVKKILAISASYDLALLETEPSSDYLTIKEDSPDKKHPDTSLWVLGYGVFELSLKERKHVGSIFHEEDTFFLTLNNPIGPGFSGSPVLNEKRELVGVVDQSISEGNMSHAVSVSAVKKFINGDIGLDCNPFPHILDCIKQEIKNLHKQAEEEQHAPSQYQLGKIYQKGNIVTRDMEKAEYWFKRAAEQGLAIAQCEQGTLYFEREEIVKAEYWFKQAAEQGFVFGQTLLGILYHREKGESEKAKYWLTQAAEQELFTAQLQLANIHKQEKDLEQAKHWYKKATELGDSRSPYNLALIDLREGNFEGAFHWFSIAAERGHVFSQYNLAVMYKKGQGTEVNMDKARYWLNKAAKQGDHRSQHNLAFIYVNESNMDMARYWFNKAAKQGNILSIHSLAIMDYQEENFQAAFHGFSIAAEKGYAPSQYSLAIMYEKGQGTEVNMDMAKYWLNKALEQGYPPSE